MPDNDLIFIKDIIYGLKHEYGTAGVIVRQTESFNIKTGQKTFVDVFRVNAGKVIFLPFSWRKFIAQKGKGGIQTVGTQEILVDKDDLPASIKIKAGDFLNAKGQRIDIGEVDDYEYAFIVKAKSLEGMPLG